LHLKGGFHLKRRRGCGGEKNSVEKILPWFHLKSVPGIGNHLFKRLIERFGSPQAVFEASPSALRGVEGLNQRLVEAIRSHGSPPGAAVEIRKALSHGFRLVTLKDSDYPPLLKEIPDPPPFLYVRGDLGSCQRCIAVVGSRNATAYGISTARQICAELAQLQFTVVSGMALGIDTAAHEGALSVRGKTAAVLGSGLNQVYPPENRQLFERIAAGGAVISEFSLDSGPDAHHFPIRNRIISGMSFGTVVVEATRNSGSLITARLAAEQNREVFAVPGSIQSFKSMGTHTLIKQGAKLVENAQDIVAELGQFVAASPPARESSADVAVIAKHRDLTAEESRVLQSLGPYPLHIDELIRQLAIEAGRLSGILLQLELKGLVQQLPGKFFLSTEKAGI
jgi:DNA processing protein